MCLASEPNEGKTHTQHIKLISNSNGFYDHIVKYDSCQNVNHIVNQFFIFLYRVTYHIMYHKIYKHLFKFIKSYRYTYINSIFIINFKYIQLMTNLFITYVIIFNKLTK